MKITKNTTLSEFNLYVDAFNLSDEHINMILDKIKEFPLPESLNISFNELTFSQLIDLQSGIKNFNGLIFIPLKVIHGLPEAKIMQMSVYNCLRFALYTKDELERITKLFKEIEYKPSPEEQKAGIDKINNGFFGTIDWYAKRMGIADHDEVVKLSWVRIYKCMKIDFDNNKFERNYRKVIETKNKKK